MAVKNINRAWFNEKNLPRFYQKSKKVKKFVNCVIKRLTGWFSSDNIASVSTQKHRVLKI